MTDRPYTDDDLITEAARQHQNAVEDPEFMCIGEQMENSVIASRADWSSEAWWHSLGEDDFDAAQRAIDDLLNNAADTSEWAINLGADGLVPDAERQITINAGEKPIARVLLAFEPGVSEDSRNALVTGIGDAMARYIPEIGQ